MWFSIGQADHVHAPNISFHNVGLWGDDITDSHGWTLLKFSTIRARLGHQSVCRRNFRIQLNVMAYRLLGGVVVRPSDL